MSNSMILKTKKWSIECLDLVHLGAFTNYIYVSTGTKSEPVMKNVSIMTPDKASKMEVGLVMWGYLDSPEGSILLKRKSDI